MTNSEFVSKMARVKKIGTGKNFLGRVSNRKNLDLSVKMNALSNYIVKIEKQNFAPAGVQKNVRFFRGTSLKSVLRLFNFLALY